MDEQTAEPSLAGQNTSALGARLRRRRRERGMTLQQVAAGAGLSVGFISQIERGLTAPSLSSLASIAHVLTTDVREFFAQPKGDAPLTRHAQRAIYAVGGNSLKYERLSATFPGNVLRSVIIHEPPGHRSEPIAHEGEEIFFILNGAITVEVDGKVTVLEGGDSIHFPSTLRHSTWNHTNTTTTILHTCTMDVFGDEANAAQGQANMAVTRNRTRKPASEKTNSNKGKQ